MFISFVVIMPVVKTLAMYRTPFECMPVVLIKQGLIVEPIFAEATLFANILDLEIASRRIVDQHRPAGSTVVRGYGGGAIRRIVHQHSIGVLRDQTLKSLGIELRKLPNAVLSRSGHGVHVEELSTVEESESVYLRRYLGKFCL
jgi:hypothetical protein